MIVMPLSIHFHILNGTRQRREGIASGKILGCSRIRGMHEKVRDQNRTCFLSFASDAESMAGRTANGSVSRFPPAKRDRRRSRERSAKTSGDESDDTQRQRRQRRRQERMRAVMTDTEAMVQSKEANQSHRRYSTRFNNATTLFGLSISPEILKKI